MAKTLVPLGRLLASQSATPQVQLLEASAFMADALPSRLSSFAGLFDRLPDRYQRLPNVDRLRASCRSKAAELGALTTDELVDSAGPAPQMLVGLESELRVSMGKIMGELGIAHGADATAGPGSATALALQRCIAPAWDHSLRLQTLLRHHHRLSALVADPADDSAEIVAAVERLQLVRELDGAVQDTLALTNEKYGVRPEVIIDGEPAENDAIEVLCSRGHLRVMLLELLKNASAAMINRHGIDADMADPIRISMGRTEGEVGVQITDAGAGIPHRDMAKCFHFFYTTVPYREPTYADGSNFGGELEGRGVGLPLCKAYAGVYRGNVSMASAAGCGTTVCLSLRDDAVL